MRMGYEPEPWTHYNVYDASVLRAVATGKFWGGTIVHCTALKLCILCRWKSIQTRWKSSPRQGVESLTSRAGWRSTLIMIIAWPWHSHYLHVQALRWQLWIQAVSEKPILITFRSSKLWQCSDSKYTAGISLAIYTLVSDTEWLKSICCIRHDSLVRQIERVSCIAWSW